MEHLKKTNMRNYIAKIKLTDFDLKHSSGKIAETVFEKWFTSNFQGEQVFKQCAENDYKGIDFADERGVTYQVKGTVGRTYTFNCDLEHIREHLRASKYVCIQVRDKFAYIESIYNAEEIANLARHSFQFDKSCFIWAKDLQQYTLEL